MNPSGKVKFMYVERQSLPSTVDKSTMYIVNTTPKTLYIGSDPIGGGGGADLSQDIVSLNSNDDPYGEISFYISGDPTAPEPMDTIDNLPLKDSYADKFMYELDVVDSTITSTTTPVDTSDYYENNLVVMHGITVLNSSDHSPYLLEDTYYEIPELIHLHHHVCPYLEDEDPYMYFYYYYDDYSKYEVWSRSVPLAVDGLGSSSSYTGQLVSYDFDNETVEVVNLSGVSNNDIVLFVDGTQSYSNQFPQWSSSPSSRLNIIKYNSTDADSETAIIQFLKLTYDLNYGKKSYGIFVDFVHGFMGDKYLVFPIWDEVFAQTIEGNKFIKGAVTSPLVEGEFAVFEYRTDFIEYSDSLKNPPLYEGVFHLFDPIDATNKKLLVEKNPLGTKYPASFMLYDYIVTNNSDIDTEYAKESLYVEFSKNGLQYNRYTRGSGGGDDNELGERVQINDICRSSSYIEINTDCTQYMTDITIKLLPNIDGSTIYGARRNTPDNIFFGTYASLQANQPISYAYLMWGQELTANTIKCPYNDKSYKYTYYLRNDYYENTAYIIYSNYVLVAINGSVYYLNAGTSSSNDNLVELTEVPSSDTDYYWLFSSTEGTISFTRYTGGTTSLNMWPTLSPNESPYYYGTNMLNFTSSSEALSYASYYYDHSMAYPSARSNPDYLYSCLGGLFDINKREFYSWDFMESYNGMNFEHSDAFEKTHWYQENASNDPESPVYSPSATPTIGDPIVYTKSYNIPYTLVYTIYHEDGDTSDSFKLQNGRNEVYFNRPQGGDGRIKFNYCSAKYPTIEETTDIRKDIYELKALAQHSAQEIADARIGVDGTVYASLGEAIRTQISDLANGILDALNDDY